MVSAVRRARGARVLDGAGWALIVLGMAGLAVSTIHQHYYETLNATIAPRDAPVVERVLRTFEIVSSWEYFDPERIESPVARGLARIEHASSYHLSAWSVLNAGADHIGACGSTSRAMIVLLRESGIPARKVILYRGPGDPQHTVVEVLIDGEWRVFDTTYGYYWTRDADGEIATVADLATDPSLFRRILQRNADYPLDLYHYRYVHHLRWEKVPALRPVRAGLSRILGERWVRQAPVPYAYERPYATAGSAFTLLGVALLLVSHRTGAAARFRNFWRNHRVAYGDRNAPI